MASQLSPSDTEALRSVQDVLREEWEPISAAWAPGDYAAQAFSRARRHDSAEKIARYLTKVETEEMGLALVPGVQERNLRVAERVIQVVDAASA